MSSDVPGEKGKDVSPDNTKQVAFRLPVDLIERIAPSVEKVLKSAIANARNNANDIDVDNLIVSEAYVNEGPRQKRVRPAPMGRAYRYQRRSAHIVIGLAEKGA